MLERLRDGGVVVIDGGMGTELEARGAPMDHDAWCGLANLDAPDLVRAIHEDHIRAGADVVIANTFPCNRLAMEAAGFGDRVGDMNRAAVHAAIQARDRAADGREVAVAGSMSLWGTFDEGWQEPPDDLLLDVYGEQAEMLAHAGADLLVLEMLDARWATALAAAARTGLPVWAGIWADLAADGRPLRPKSDRPLEDDLPALLDAADPIAAVLVMHTELPAVVPTLDLVARHYGGPRGAYPHHGRWERPHWVFEDIAPEAFADEAERWLDQGAQLAGGCCGTRPEHVRAIRERVDRRGAAVSGR
jgi:methionine synthase I (cobalamin-dependent)